MSQLIDTQTLAERLEDSELCLFDLRFSLEQPGQGRLDFAAGHIPGARYLHLDDDLSAAVVPGQTGRHPLPDPERLSACLRRNGVNGDSLVVVYDDGPGLFAARLWWLLRWLGHERVKLLNGGLRAWVASGRPLSSDTPRPAVEGNFQGRADHARLIDVAEILKRQDDPGLQLLDARGAPRYTGEQEPIDPVAGHIPGAACLPCVANVGADGLWLPAAELAARFKPWQGEGQVLACYCGSGVTACHNILAAVEAGLPEPRLYAGSWSEWITDPQRPVATGMTP